MLEFKEKFYKLSIKPRKVSIHQNKFHSVVNGSVIVMPNSNSPIDELIRNNSGSIVRKTIKKARKNAKTTDISKYLPVGYLRISIYSKDFRVRKLENSGLIPELLCTIEFKRLQRIQTIDIIGGIPEKINKLRIVWNANAKIIDNIRESQTNIKKLGDLVISGEDAGVYVVSEINMWSEPKSAIDGSYVVGKISNACPKTEVPYYEERDLRTLNGRIWYKVESGNIVGWITDSFVIQKK